MFAVNGDNESEGLGDNNGNVNSYNHSKPGPSGVDTSEPGKGTGTHGPRPDHSHGAKKVVGKVTVTLSR